MKKIFTRRTVTFICSLILIATLILGNAPPVSATNNSWYDKYIDAEANMGDNYHAAVTSTSLAWDESYVLQSYIEMYNVTKDTNWLDKIIHHVDTMISHTNDDDGDGYLGWYTDRYSPQLTINNGFETGDSGDSTLPANWTRYQSNSTTAYRSTSATYSGSYGLVLKTNGTSWQSLYQDIGSYYPGNKMSLTIDAKTNGVVHGWCYVIDKTTSTILAEIVVDTTSWTEYSVDFNAPSIAGHDVEVWMTHGSYNVTDGIAYYDNIKVKNYFQYQVHDAQITLPIAEFVKLIHDVPALQSAYQTKADTYQNFIEDEIFPKWENTNSYYGNCWEQENSTHGYYKLCSSKNTYVSSTPGDQLPYNMNLVYAKMLLLMYNVNGSSTYYDRARAIVTHWHETLTNNGSSYNMFYEGSSVEDTSHGMLDVAAAIEFYRQGIVFNGSNIDRLTNNLTDLMWNGSLTAPTVSAATNGTGSTSTFTRSLCNWTELAQFDSNVWKIAAEQFRNYTVSEATDLLVLAQIMKWDPEKIVNSGFEYRASSDITLPSRWSRWQSTSSNAYLVYNSASGERGLVITTNGTQWLVVEQAIQEYKANTSYTMAYCGKSSSSTIGGRVEIYNATSETVIASQIFTDTVWTNHSFTFTTPNNTTDTIKVRLYQSSYSTAGISTYFDNVVIKRTGDAW